ncbi:hypothetical protein AGLY_013112, partial [Aphis glycines]
MYTYFEFKCFNYYCYYYYLVIGRHRYFNIMYSNSFVYDQNILVSKVEFYYVIMLLLRALDITSCTVLDRYTVREMNSVSVSLSRISDFFLDCGWVWKKCVFHPLSTSCNLSRGTNLRRQYSQKLYQIFTIHIKKLYLYCKNFPDNLKIHFYFGPFHSFENSSIQIKFSSTYLIIYNSVPLDIFFFYIISLSYSNIFVNTDYIGSLLKYFEFVFYIFSSNYFNNCNVPKSVPL